MKYCEALIIGGSAGSLNVIISILPSIKSVLSFAIIVVLHRKAGKDLLSELLASKTEMAVKEIDEKEKIKPSHIYIAPPNYHLLIEEDRTFSLDASEKVNFSRPAIDVTFQSAAEVFKSNLVCLLLSGANSDGTDGLIKVKKNGGTVLIQDPSTAVVNYMPQNAMDHVVADKVLKIDEMADYINRLTADDYE
ncbi:chemotaxis protein CheB [Chryseobacterium taklimakanense]|uniref:chemotaxis protein CheB n=1 Tax=Chryseobacterium taklimakanense TaxID=536441 RepID=UPI0023F88060|nr:chemotaxis protein CheB [Chryseobacterium taklimakanense]